MDQAEMRRSLAAARVGRLATIRPDGRPHVVVCCFALTTGDDGEDIIWTIVDGKPKSTKRLQRLRNVEANPTASLLVDHYDDTDWSQLWWVRVDGTIGVEDAPPPRVLTAKYPQYGVDPPTGPLLRLRVRRWIGWTAGREQQPKKDPENL